jgi:circadian clock protein KaiC
MAAKKKGQARVPETIEKASTGINGLDEIMFGGLPAGRPTLICGGPGAGKTMLAAEILVCGATECDEPGVFMMFEETAEELTANVRSLGFDLEEMIADKKLVLDHVHVERSEIEETGEYDLEGLFIRLGHAIDSIGAKRVVLDTLEALFSGLPNQAILRAELRRLFRWLKNRGVTAIITGERGEGTLTRYGLEEYVSDCVILLDNRVKDQVSTRRLRIVKYRGSPHGTNEYPFLIGSCGITVMPITSVGLDHAAPTETVSTGVPHLDEMFAGRGMYRGTSFLVTGSAGTGKSSLAASFVAAACKRGERALMFAYEESEDQVVRNMRSIGIDLAKFVKKGLLQIHSSRPTLQGLEQHLVTMYDTIKDFDPQVVVVDPMTDLGVSADESDVKPTLIRLVDFMKRRGITTCFTSLISGTGNVAQEGPQVNVSSLMDTWILLRNIEYNGERNRTLFVLKSRGMAHSNQVREFVMSDKGISLVDVYQGNDTVLTGTARVAQAEKEAALKDLREREMERRLAEIELKRKEIEMQRAALEAEATTAAHEAEVLAAERSLLRTVEERSAQHMKQSRAGTATKEKASKGRVRR